MTGQSFDYYLEELQRRRRARRWRAKVALACAVLGSAYGATLGVTIGAVPPAAEIIEIAAAALGLIFAVPGARIGFFIGLLGRARFGRYYPGIVAALAGALLGGFLAAMLLMAFGAILGAIVGWFAARAIAARQRSPITRLATGLAGIVLGTFLGVVVWGLRLNQPGALIGLAWGLGIGAIAGLLLLLAFVCMMNSIPSSREMGRRDYVDATFRSED